MKKKLSGLLESSAARRGPHTAVEHPERGTSITYEELNSLSEVVRKELFRQGVRQGDRVGIYGPKSIGTVASIFGVLKAGAAYVPVDASAPVERNAAILKDCSIRAVVVAEELADELNNALAAHASRLTELPGMSQFGTDMVLVSGIADRAQTTAATAAPDSRDISYLLYTSGSTGKPKGVIHTHHSALSFVDWCSEAFEPTETDRFSSHAPFHFDLSILDLYVPLKHGATVVLFGQRLGKLPARLAEAIADSRISVWYSTPSVLRYLVEFGRMERYDWSSLRLALFAGEVFPIKHLRMLKDLWPRPRHFNLYGPTETNVCTYYELPVEIPGDRHEPFPIGGPCSGDRTRIVDDNDREVSRGVEGELLVSGGSVMQGYWNLPEQTESAFLMDAEGARWYRTGDMVREDEKGVYTFLGRGDRMIKKRGFRIELGEIEAVLYRHRQIVEAAVVALTDDEDNVVTKAYLSCPDDTSLSQIELKTWCAGHLPLYMVPDQFAVLPSLPKTSTDKIDYQTLKRMARSTPR